VPFTTPPTLLVSPARQAPAVWTAQGKVWSFGGYNLAPTNGYASRTDYDDGAIFDPGKNVWDTLPAGGPSGRAHATAVWTGQAVILWGGDAGPAKPVLFAQAQTLGRGRFPLGDGFIYVP
jgi:hypothetical protein